MAIAEALSRRRLYYGWYIVAVAFLVNFVSLGINASAVGVFIKPMTEDLGWSRGFFSLAVTLGSLISAPLALAVGPLVDRRGARGIMLLGGFVIGAGTIALGFVHEEWQFLALRTVLAPLAMAGLGQLATQVTVSNWFIKKRGRALGITIAGSPAGGMVTVLAATYLISALDWRRAWIVLGVAAWVLVLPATAIFMKRRPEDLGLLPDGESPETRVGLEKRAPTPEVVWTRREAVRTPALWLLAIGFPFGFMAATTLTQHLIPYLTDIHLSRQTAAFMMTLIFITSMAVKPIAGLIAERVAPKYVLASMYALLGFGVGGLLLVGDNKAALYVIVIFLGTAWGGIVVLQALLWANYFGRPSLGLVQSLAMPISSALSPLGPVLAGYVWDVTGTYRGIFAGYIGAEALAFVLIMIARSPRKAAPTQVETALVR